MTEASYQRAYYASHRERKQAYAREYYLRNRDAILDYHRKLPSKNALSAWPCPMCGKPVARFGGSHFVAAHGMTAQEVRLTTEKPTVHPVHGVQMRGEVTEYLTDGTRRWTNEALIGALQSYTKRHGSPPTYRKWAKAAAGRPTAATVVKRFGSWNAGLTAAELPNRDAVAPGYVRTKTHRKRQSKAQKNRRK